MSTADASGDGVRAVTDAVATSRRYAAVAPGVVRRTASRALRAANGDVAQAVKRTKRGLHEIYGAYLPGSPPDYPALLRKLAAAGARADGDGMRPALAAAMAVHASSRERLPHLARFYDEILRRIPPPAVVCDLACGFNPLALPWMRLPPAAVYLASDIDSRLTGFVGQVLELLGRPHEAQLLDLVGQPAPAPADLTLLLKTVPCLERQQPGAGWDLLAAVDSPAIVVTFPTRSLGQRPKGMFQTYSAAFEARTAGRPWQVDRWEIGSELVYLVRK
jgi:16S rRNA (guanine(1405)-N(7))-methyltransferase